MARLLAYDRVAVLSRDGAELGLVGAVLFHPHEPRVVGFEIDRPAALGLLKRPPRYVPLDALAVSGEALVLDAKKLPTGERAEWAPGAGWETTVIWRGMPVRSAAGEPVGAVHDAVFDATTGRVTLLRISTGVVGDVALGRMEVPGDLVQGFDGGAVRVLPGYAAIPADGGAARHVAAGVAAVKEQGARAADGALKAGVSAARVLGRSMRSPAARKAADKFKSLMGDDE